MIMKSVTFALIPSSASVAVRMPKTSPPAAPSDTLKT